jgi:hypothetical protein
MEREKAELEREMRHKLEEVSSVRSTRQSAFH